MKPVMMLLIVFLTSVYGGEKVTLAEVTKEKLQSYIIARVDMVDITLEEALDELRLRMIELHHEPRGQRGISIVVKKIIDFKAHQETLGLEKVARVQKDEKLITLQKENINCFDALVEICKQAGMTFSIGEKGIVITAEKK